MTMNAENKARIEKSREINPLDLIFWLARLLGGQDAPIHLDPGLGKFVYDVKAGGKWKRLFGSNMDIRGVNRIGMLNWTGMGRPA
jgi:hypothetical protein